MKTSKAASLSTESIISIAREGGFAFMPGLAKPRRIVLSKCSEDEQNRIAELIGSVAVLAVPDAGRGDQRYYRIEIVPEALVKLWEKAGQA